MQAASMSINLLKGITLYPYPKPECPRCYQQIDLQKELQHPQQLCIDCQAHLSYQKEIA